MAIRKGASRAAAKTAGVLRQLHLRKPFLRPRSPSAGSRRPAASGSCPHLSDSSPSSPGVSASSAVDPSSDPPPPPLEASLGRYTSSAGSPLGTRVSSFSGACPAPVVPSSCPSALFSSSSVLFLSPPGCRVSCLVTRRFLASGAPAPASVSLWPRGRRVAGACSSPGVSYFFSASACSRPVAAFGRGMEGRAAPSSSLPPRSPHPALLAGSPSPSSRPPLPLASSASAAPESARDAHAEAPGAAAPPASGDAPAAAVAPEPLTWNEWWRVFSFSALPMVAFGLMDQFIMIRLGDLLDTTLGVTLGLATLSAAAVGQLCSDTAGVLFGNTIESLAQRFGVATPPFEIYTKRAPSSTNLVRTLGAACGVAVGCLLGMTQLLFMDLDRAERLKKQQQLDAIFRLVMQECPRLFSCERATLFVYDRSRNEIWSKAVFGLEHATRVEKGEQNKTVTTWILEHKQLVNCPDAYRDPRFNPRFDERHKIKTHTLLAAPVFGKDRDVVAVLMCINKHAPTYREETSRRESYVFTDQDEKMIQLLSKNIEIFMEQFNYGAADDQNLIALPVQPEHLPSGFAADPAQQAENVARSSWGTGSLFFPSFFRAKNREEPSAAAEPEAPSAAAPARQSSTQLAGETQKGEEGRRGAAAQGGGEKGVSAAKREPDAEEDMPEELSWRQALLAWMSAHAGEVPSAAAAPSEDAEESEGDGKPREDSPMTGDVILMPRFEIPLMRASTSPHEEKIDKQPSGFAFWRKRERRSEADTSLSGA
ncbi:GAF domain-containing protein [Besnoitia besnoiti]|uniref:GAF domain-containing protein n=1 Tax=Besnoitia besnoiti TaxID=94643 RepID=A0A2A9MCX9_BESBE|nr:GAF domain-containing protein [Besnoitia besnoiti]PFH35729.1 GAF domain-containing protein [Besnoitia besnoiti]